MEYPGIWITVGLLQLNCQLISPLGRWVDSYLLPAEPGYKVAGWLVSQSVLQPGTTLRSVQYKNALHFTAVVLIGLRPLRIASRIRK